MTGFSTTSPLARVPTKDRNPPAAEIQTEALPTQLIRCEVFILGLTSGRN